MAGKGSRPRPVKKKEFDNNFDTITWSAKNQEIRNYVSKKGKKIYKYPWSDMIDQIREKCLMFSASEFLLELKQHLSFLQVMLVPLYVVIYSTTFALLVLIGLLMTVATYLHELQSQSRAN